MGNNLPTLSSSAWVGSVPEKADKLLSYYFANEASQSNLYRGKIISLTHQIQEFGSDPDTLQSRIRSTMEQYLSGYFDSVQVRVDTKTPLPGDPNRIQITLTVDVVEDGISISLGRQVLAINGSIKEIIDLNNNKGG